MASITLMCIMEITNEQVVRTVNSEQFSKKGLRCGQNMEMECLYINKAAHIYLLEMEWNAHCKTNTIYFLVCILNNLFAFATVFYEREGRHKVYWLCASYKGCQLNAPV